MRRHIIKFTEDSLGHGSGGFHRLVEGVLLGHQCDALLSCSSKTVTDDMLTFQLHVEAKKAHPCKNFYHLTV